MPSRIRSIVAGSLLAVLVIAGSAASALAAAPADQGRYTFGDDYCFVDVNATYCFEQDGQLHFVALPDGREMATINFRQTTRIYQGGVLVGESSQVSMDKSVWEDGGLGTFTSVSHTNARNGDVTCVLTTVLKVSDYDVTVDHWNAPACS